MVAKDLRIQNWKICSRCSTIDRKQIFHSNISVIRYDFQLASGCMCVTACITQSDSNSGLAWDNGFKCCTLIELSRLFFRCNFYNLVLLLMRIRYFWKMSKTIKPHTTITITLFSKTFDIDFDRNASKVSGFMEFWFLWKTTTNSAILVTMEVLNLNLVNKWPSITRRPIFFFR